MDMLPERGFVGVLAPGVAVRACATSDASQISALRPPRSPAIAAAPDDGRRDLREQSYAKQQLGEMAA